jgi:glycosyltransferase involved in cell wall biosynthesis
LPKASPKPIISVVVLTYNEGKRLRETVKGLRETLPERSEIVVVDDGSTDGSTAYLKSKRAGARVVHCNRLGTARARNFGIGHANGEVVVFADAHIRLPDGWWRPMLELLGRQRTGAVAPSVSDTTERECHGYGLRLAGPDLMIEWLPPRRSAQYRVPLLPGCCLAMRRDTIQTIGGFDDGLVRWGGVEHELGVRLWLAGYEMWLVRDVDCVHFFREDRPFRVKWSGVLHNRLRLAYLHFSRARIARVIEALQGHDGFPEAAAMLADSDVWDRRRQLSKTRLHDAEWYFERFGPEW